MQVTVVEFDIIDENFATARRMLCKIIDIMDLTLHRIERMHNPEIKDKNWQWRLITTSSNPRWRLPVYFSVNRVNLQATLGVTRRFTEEHKTKKRIIVVQLPTAFNEINKEETWRNLGFV
jgi:hypothetical protein